MQSSVRACVLTRTRPAFGLFDALRRYLNAQSIFTPTSYILAVTAPLNIILNYLLVWHPKLGFGFLGAPTAVVITYWSQVILTLLYIVFVDGSQCWDGFTWDAFRNLG